MSAQAPAGEDMLALVVRGPREHALERIPRPVPGPDDALVAVTHVAVCGTDYRLLRGTLHDADYPVIPGHEWAGRVVEAPSRPELVGQAVVGDGLTPCGRCEPCSRGAYNLCTDLDEIGFTRPGAFAEAFVLPAANLIALPPSLSGPEGCLLEPLCIALHALERGPDVAGKAVGIIGGGTIGLLIGQLAAAGGAARVSVAEPSQRRRVVAAELGLAAVPALSDWDEEPEIVYDATGVAAVFPEGLQATRTGGAYVLVGYSGEESTVMAPSTVMLRELTVYGVLSGHRQLEAAVEMALNGAVCLGPLLGEPLALEDYRTMLEERGDAAPLRTVFATGLA